MSDPNTVSLYGPDAILSSSAPTEAELALIEKAQNVEIRNGDTTQVPDLEQEQPNDEPNEGTEDPKDPEGDKPDEVLEGSDADIAAKATASRQAMDDLGADLQAKGIDIAAIEAEYTEEGALKAETYETLKAAGLSKGMVDSIIAGRVAIANSFTNALLARAGGEAGFKALAESASAETRVAFNEAVKRNDLGTAAALLEGLKASRAARLGTANKQINGQPAKQASNVVGYENRQEMTKAMADPRYGRDVVYTKQVEAKVGAAKFF